METLTQEEYEFLQKYEDRLQSATTSSYIRALRSGEIHKMREIYSRLIGKTYQMNESCGSCILNLCRKLYPIYNEYRNNLERDSSGQTAEDQCDSDSTVGGKVKTRNTKRNETKV